MAATIRDIKKMTGLSLSTISKYLNGKNVLPENRAMIEHSIEVLHYEVNEVARGLATNRTKTVGVLIHSLDNVFAGSIIASIEDILRNHDYGTIVCDCRQDTALEEEEIRFLLGKRVDGIITIPTSTTSGYLDEARKRKIPIVLIDRAFEDQEFDCILVDNVNASKEAVKVLLEQGHKKIGMICGTDHVYTARERLRGYYDALEEAKLQAASELVCKGELSVKHGYDSMIELMNQKERPTAVFLSNYEITLGAVVALNKIGLRFPEDLSIIGFDNMMLSQVVKPKLYMVVQPMEEIARNAAELLLKKLSGNTEEPPVKRFLSTSLLHGESIGKRTI